MRLLCVRTRPGSRFRCTPGNSSPNACSTGQMGTEGRGIAAGSSQCSCLAGPVVTQKGSDVALVEIKTKSS